MGVFLFANMFVLFYSNSPLKFRKLQVKGNEHISNSVFLEGLSM